MKKKILIYDDDAEILLLCKIILRRENFEVETLSICENILEDICTIKPDLILMDLWIPKLGGEKSIEIIKQDKSTSFIPVFLFSANADIKLISEKVNADGYIEKPFEVKAFVDKIQRALN